MIKNLEDLANPFKKPEDEPGYQWIFAWSNSRENPFVGRWTKVPVAQDKDPFTWGNPDYKPKEEIEGLSTEIDYDLIKNVIDSDNPDAKKIAVYLKEMTEQKLEKLAETYYICDFDITEENEYHFIQWIAAKTYFGGLRSNNRFYLANFVTSILIDEDIFGYVYIEEGDYEKTNMRCERIKHMATEHVIILRQLDEFINS